MVVSISKAAKHQKMLMKCMKGVFQQPTTSILFSPTIPTIISFRAIRSGYATKRVYVSAKWPSKSNFKLVPMKAKIRLDDQSVALSSTCPKLISYEQYVAEEEAKESIKTKNNPPTIQDLEHESYKKILAKQKAKFNKIKDDHPMLKSSESYKKVSTNESNIKKSSESLAKHKHDFKKQFIDSSNRENPKIQYSKENLSEFDSAQNSATQDVADELVPKNNQPEISDNTEQKTEPNVAPHGYYACNPSYNGYSPCGHYDPCVSENCQRLYSCGYNPYGYGYSGIASGCNVGSLGSYYLGNQTGQPSCAKPPGCSCDQPGCGYCAMKITPGCYYRTASACKCGQPGCRNCGLPPARVYNAKPSDYEKPSDSSCREPGCIYCGMRAGGFYGMPSGCRCGQSGCRNCGMLSGRVSNAKPSDCEKECDSSFREPGCVYCGMQSGGFYGMPSGCRCGQSGCRNCGMLSERVSDAKPSDCEKESDSSCREPGCVYCGMQSGGFYGMPSGCRCGQSGCRNCGMLSRSVSDAKPSDSEKQSDCNCREPGCFYCGMKSGGYYRNQPVCKCGKAGCGGYCANIPDSNKKPTGGKQMTDSRNLPVGSLTGRYQVPRIGPGSTAYMDPRVYNDSFYKKACQPRRGCGHCGRKYVYDCNPSHSCGDSYSGCRCGACCYGCTPCAYSCGCGGQSWGPSNVTTMNPACANQWSSRVFLPGVKMSDD